MEKLDSLTWPAEWLGEAITVVAQRQGWQLRDVESPAAPPSLGPTDVVGLGAWLEATATWLGLTAEPIQTSYAEIEDLVRGAGPALLRVPGQEKPKLLVLLKGRGRQVRLLGPDLNVHRMAVDDLCQVLRNPIESVILPEIEAVLGAMDMNQKRRERTRRAMLRERLSAQSLEYCWLLCLASGTSFWQHLQQARLPYCLAQLIGMYSIQHVCWILSWWLLGLGALQGRFDIAWLAAWGLLLLSMIPLQLGSTWAQGQLSVSLGGLLKTRLLAGTLRLTPEEVRHQGVGQFLGRVLEAGTVEALALSGGMLGLLAVIELALATAVLGSGAAGWLHGILMLTWLGGTMALSWRYFRQRQAWTSVRLTLSHTLIERMVGHRTRLVQESPATWHVGEDQELSAYLASSRRLDQAEALIVAFIPRGWLVVGLLGLIPMLMTDGGTEKTVAIGVGGILLAYYGYAKLAAGLAHLAGAVIAWQQVAPLFKAAARPQMMSPPAYATALSERLSEPRELPVLEANGLEFRHGTQAVPVLQDCSLKVWEGDRLLLEGPSGSGKSTLASIFTGLRQADRGLLLLGGLDMQTLGSDGWRQSVVSATQFHDNHIFSGTLAFNLLMGRHWPPGDEDLAAAEAVCRALDLGPLLDRMPAGLLQIVGETGWQLSHGERSRLYIARALLQDASVLILDESFAALDPKTLQRVQQCVMAHAPALMVIAHP